MKRSNGMEVANAAMAVARLTRWRMVGSVKASTTLALSLRITSVGTPLGPQNAFQRALRCAVERSLQYPQAGTKPTWGGWAYNFLSGSHPR